MRALVALALTSCWTTSQPGDPGKPPAPVPVEIAIASVRLADDCPGSEIAVAPPLVQGSMAGDCAGDCSIPRACEQTLLQVSVRSGSTEATSVAIKRIEVLDATGKTVGTLRARNPTRWAQSGTYTQWNQIVGPGELLSASYALTAPDWGALPQGRDPSVIYKVRVTFAVGGGEKTIEKQAVVAAFTDPNVVT